MAVSNLYLLRYNNYYNRIVKKEETLDDYRSYIIKTQTAVNFNPSDGLHTSQVLNCESDELPDYIIETDLNNNIKSRWFVLEAGRNLKGQYYVQLRRDVVVDYYNELVSSPAFIQRGTLEASDPLIYNPENVSFNKIKTSEHLLKDESGCAWVVGYFDSGATEFNATAAFSPSVYETAETIADFTLSNGLNYQDIVEQSAAGGYHAVGTSDVKLTVALGQLKDRLTLRASSVPLAPSNFWAATLANGSWEYNTVGDNGRTTYDPITQTTTSEQYSNHSIWDDDKGRAFTTNASQEIPGFGSLVNFKLNYEALKPEIKLWMNNNATLQGQAVKFLFLDGGASKAQYEEMLALNGRYIATSTDSKIYKILCYTEEENISTYSGGYSSTYYGRFITPTNSPTLWNACDSAITEVLTEQGISYELRTYTSPEAYELEYKTSTRLYFNLIDVTDSARCTLDLGNEANRVHPVDAPYDIFCIPYNKTEPVQIYDGNTVAFNVTPDIAMQLANEFSRKFSGAGTLYDIQLLPYCPVRNYDILVDGKIDISQIKSDTLRYKPITFEGNNVGAAFMCDKSSFSFDINYSIAVEDVKIENQTDMYRLCSPNYAGLFEFNAAKNNGVEYINVDCTYLPHNPYIHLNINFKNLYGGDYNDVRGLVCGGDFSLPKLTDAWETYQLNNKNYQAMFDRQIRSMDVNYEINRTEAIVGAVAGVFGGATSGAAAGAQTGNVGAAVGGAVAGGLASGVGAYFDLKHMEQRYNESRSYATDMHNLQLGNVQALPTTLARTTAYTFNNKIFPFIEFYTCTPAEREAFRAKLQWEGMTVGRHDLIKNYINNTDKRFLQCVLKRLENVADEYHIVNAISEELQKGVYI